MPPVLCFWNWVTLPIFFTFLPLLFNCLHMFFHAKMVAIKTVSWSVHCDGSSGAIATDFDGDGRLELVVSHGESAAQPLSVYKVNQVSVLVLNSILHLHVSLFNISHSVWAELLTHQGLTNSWLRVIPRTKFGAFARGAKVVVYTKKSGPHTRIIDGGSGYLCEMEPVAHFGLGKIT